MNTSPQMVDGSYGSLKVPEILDQVDRIAASSGFKNSDPIRNVFLFLAKLALESPGQAVKEYEIATMALGRSPDFDPRSDSTVRVVVTRLRAKLADYYIHQGVDDPILVDLPKGAYLISFSARKDSVVSDSHSQLIPVSEPIAPALASQRPHWLRWVAGSIVLLLVAVSAYFAGWNSARPHVPVIINSFWSRFLKSGMPLVVYSNPIFQGTPEKGMHLLDPSAFHTEGTNDTFTGTGEVVAVQALTEQITQLGHPLRVKRSRLFTWDEAVTNSLIFVGGPAQSSAFTQLPKLEKFVLKPPSEEPFPAQEAIRNEKPVHEQTYYLPVRNGDKGTEYAIVALTPGASPDHWVLVLAGTNTQGTEAAARFVCSADLLQELADRLTLDRRHPVFPPFEALLRVEIRGGTPLETQLLIAYRRQS